MVRSATVLNMLFLTTAFTGITVGDAVAATHRKGHTSVSRLSRPAHPVQSAGKPVAGMASTRAARSHLLATGSEDVAVSATRHRAHGAQITVGRTLISQAVPGTNPMKVLAQVPGVMFQSSDAQGLDTWSAQLFMHGFQQQEIGMTLDGIPLGEMTYRNYNGLNPLQAISSENVARMDVSQSAGAESVAATNNLGGSIEYVSSDPKDRDGGVIAQTFGSNSTFHTFVRLDSGKLNATGTKFYVSYMRNDSMKWKEYGEEFNQQVNAKLVQPIREKSKFSFFFDWSDLHQYAYQDMSFDILNKLGGRVDNYYNGSLSGYKAAYAAAQGVYPAGYNKLSDPLDASYYDGGQNDVDMLGGAKADLALTDQMRWVTTVYGHSQESQTTWGTPYFSSPNGAPLSEIVKEPGIRRFGILSAVHYTIAHNELGAGVWYENNKYNSPMNAYEQPMIINGVVQGQPLDSLKHYSDPFARIFNQIYNTNTFTAFVQDTYRPVKNLALHFGFKSVLNTTRVGSGYLNPTYYGSDDQITSGVGLTTAKAFLPHIAVDWNFLKHHELFIDISENVHTYAQSGYKLSNSPFAVLQSAFNASRATLAPETAWTYAIGYRYTDRLLAASVYAYRTNFNNRLQQITEGSAINPVSAVQNVGGVTMNGVDAGLTITPLTGLSLYNSISYDHAVYDNNISNAGVSYVTKNQQIVNYPRFMYKSRLSYEWHGALAWIDGTYVGTRNFTYEGDIKAPGYWLANLGVQYRFGEMEKYSRHLSFIKNVIVSFNISNLTNTRYISTMGENGNPMSLQAGGMTDQSFLLGAPRQYYGSIRAEF